MWYGHEMWGNGWMLLFMVVFWGGILIIGLSLLRLLFATAQPTEKKPNPLEVAATRYAHGEISQAEYEQIVQVLRATKPDH